MVDIMTRMDLALGDLMANLRHQATNKKISSFESVGKGNHAISIDVVPSQITMPPMANKWGRPAKMTRLSVEARPSTRQSSVLNP